MSSTDLRGAVAVVTGASAGVGRATARALAAAGTDVALLARGDAGLEAAAHDVRAEGVRALPLTVDVADADAVDGAAARVEAELGPVDIWVNDAMATVFAWSWDVTPDEFRRATEVTYLGQVHGSMAALRHMRPRDRGTIVNVGSALSFMSIPLQLPYCGAKYAVRGFTEGLQAELRASGSQVRLSIVHLPAVNTPQFGWSKVNVGRHPRPVPPIYQPEVAAAAVLRAVRTGRRSVTLGSWNRMLIAIARGTPRLALRFAARTAVDAQQTDQQVGPDRPSNLYEPVDDAEDHGARGVFDDQAGGVLQPGFLKSLPGTLRKVLRPT